jgi:hypothetical protein
MRRLSVEGRSSTSSRAGGRVGAVCVAMAKASSGDRREERGFIVFTSLRHYGLTCARDALLTGTQPNSRNSAIRVATSAPASPAVGTRPL